MVSFRQAQTGNRVYRGVGQSPNLGQVSASGAQGYMKRELRKPKQGVRPVGNDGKSDRRSGVAARALQNNLAQNGGRSAQRGNGPRNPNRAGGPPAPPPGGTGQSGTPTAVGGNLPPPPPQVTVTANGTLELPYSQNMSMAAIQALGESNDELLSLQQEEQQMQMQAMQGRRDADLAYKQLQEGSLNTNAAGGTAFSSMYGKSVADNATAYTNTLSDISRQEADFNQQAAFRRATIQNSLAQQLAAAAQENQVELTDSAGSLGFGRYQGDTHSHDKNRNKNKNKNKSGARPAKGKGRK